MTPLPKRRQSRGRTRRRRSHDALKAVPLVECQSCHQMHLAHRICHACGSYAGQTVIEVENQ